VVVAQEVQVPHEGAAGHLQLADEVAAVGKTAGAGAFADDLQDAPQPVILGPRRGLHLRSRGGISREKTQETQEGKEFL